LLENRLLPAGPSPAAAAVAAANKAQLEAAHVKTSIVPPVKIATSVPNTHVTPAAKADMPVAVHQPLPAAAMKPLQTPVIQPVSKAPPQTSVIPKSAAMAPAATAPKREARPPHDGAANSGNGTMAFAGANSATAAKKDKSLEDLLKELGQKLTSKALEKLLKQILEYIAEHNGLFGGGPTDPGSIGKDIAKEFVKWLVKEGAREGLLTTQLDDKAQKGLENLISAVVDAIFNGLKDPHKKLIELVIEAFKTVLATAEMTHGWRSDPSTNPFINKPEANTLRSYTPEELQAMEREKDQLRQFLLGEQPAGKNPSIRPLPDGGRNMGGMPGQSGTSNPLKLPTGGTGNGSGTDAGNGVGEGGSGGTSNDTSDLGSAINRADLPDVGRDRPGKSDNSGSGSGSGSSGDGSTGPGQNTQNPPANDPPQTPPGGGSRLVGSDVNPPISMAETPEGNTKVVYADGSWQIKDKNGNVIDSGTKDDQPKPQEPTDQASQQEKDKNRNPNDSNQDDQQQDKNKDNQQQGDQNDKDGEKQQGEQEQDQQKEEEGYPNPEADDIERQPVDDQTLLADMANRSNQVTLPGSEDGGLSGDARDAKIGELLAVGQQRQHGDPRVSNPNPEGTDGSQQGEGEVGALPVPQVVDPPDEMTGHVDRPLQPLPSSALAAHSVVMASMGAQAGMSQAAMNSLAAGKAAVAPLGHGAPGD
jgi:hypothetical protein